LTILNPVKTILSYTARCFSFEGRIVRAKAGRALKGLPSNAIGRVQWLWLRPRFIFVFFCSLSLFFLPISFPSLGFAELESLPAWPMLGTWSLCGPLCPLLSLLPRASTNAATFYSYMHGRKASIVFVCSPKNCNLRDNMLLFLHLVVATSACGRQRDKQ
jgi:hypothetical protein